MLTYVKDEHSSNANPPIDSTDEGIVISTKLVHFENAFVPICFTEFGISICDNKGQS